MHIRSLSLVYFLVITVFGMNTHPGHGATSMVKDINKGPGSSSPSQLTNCRGIVFFIAGEDDAAELWKTNGSAAGTLRVKKLYPGWTRPQHFACASGQLFFTAFNTSRYVSQLWKSDGTTSGTKPVVVLSGDTNLFPLKGQMFFIQSRETGLELWKSNGTASGTQKIKILAQSGHAALSDPAAVNNGTIYFVIDESVHGKELWKSDGTEQGTQIVKDIVPGPANSSPNFFAFVDDQLFFFVGIPDGGHQLWKSNGTPEGTMSIRSFGNDSPQFLLAAGSKLFFYTWSWSHVSVVNETLWISDGTTAGTLSIKDHMKIFGIPTVVGEFIFFPYAGTQLWKSVGTATGTGAIREEFCNLGSIRSLNSHLVFDADDCGHGLELWGSDGTTKGTFLLRDIHPGRADSTPDDLMRYRNMILFAAEDHAHGNELWKTDGR